MKQGCLDPVDLPDSVSGWVIIYYNLKLTDYTGWEFNFDANRTILKI